MRKRKRQENKDSSRSIFRYDFTKYEATSIMDVFWEKERSFSKLLSSLVRVNSKLYQYLILKNKFSVYCKTRFFCASWFEALMPRSFI